MYLHSAHEAGVGPGAFEIIISNRLVRLEPETFVVPIVLWGRLLCFVVTPARTAT